MTDLKFHYFCECNYLYEITTLVPLLKVFWINYDCPGTFLIHFCCHNFWEGNEQESVTETATTAKKDRPIGFVECWKKMYGPFPWMELKCLKATKPLWGDNLLFITKSLQFPSTHFINLRRTKGWVDLRATNCLWTQVPWIRNPLS